MTAGFNFNYAAGFCSATPALRGNEVSMGIQKQQKSDGEYPYIELGEIVFRIPTVCPVCGFSSEEFDDSRNNQADTQYIEDDAECARRTVMSPGNSSGTNKSHPERMIDPLSQAGEENTGGQKSQWNNGISVKKRRSIKDKQRSANNCKRFIPVINFHVLKRIYWWLQHNLFIRKALVGFQDTTSPDVVKSRHTTRKRTAKSFLPLLRVAGIFDRALPVVALREMARR
ncbi:hypothetical protein HVV96_14580 [Escherichia coli]|nr:hypothetical protein HVV96_14580 [Escherichia coli]